SARMNAGIVVTGHIDRESGVQDGIARKLPAAEHLIHAAVPVAAEPAATSERHLPDGSAVEGVPHVEAGLTVIGLRMVVILPVRAGPVDAGDAIETRVVGH